PPYDRNNVGNGIDTARIIFRMWAESGALPAPYGTGATIVPALDWTRDEYGPMRKARYHHTQISTLVAGVFINQTSFFTASNTRPRRRRMRACLWKPGQTPGPIPAVPARRTSSATPARSCP
ncbi:MAG: hypothetical protein IPP94_17500, partial [Ignavibacteria bacterium]|nr:hypothetical protein [Ignavibacteria bacterium]